MVPLTTDGVIFASPEALRDVASEESDNYGAKPQSDRAADWVIAELAERQHGVVAGWQLVALGIGRRTIRYRASIGRLHRIHRDVYAVGHRMLTPKGHRMAAVLAYGSDAVLSHRSAAAQWTISQASGKIDVTTPRSKRSRPGTRAHAAILHPEDIAAHDGIPVTSVARTILDLAATLRNEALTGLIEEADRRERFDLRALDRAMARRPHAAGVARLRAVLAAYRGTPDTRSGLERGFRALIGKAGLPEPEFNVIVAGLTVDVYWPEWKLVVELDGRPFDNSPRAFETDRIRDATLQKADIRVLRVTDTRFGADPGGVLADVLALRRIATT